MQLGVDVPGFPASVSVTHTSCSQCYHPTSCTVHMQCYAHTPHHSQPLLSQADHHLADRLPREHVVYRIQNRVQ